MRPAGVKKERSFQTSVGSLVSLFLRQCELKGLSPRTVKIYREKLKMFLTFLDGKKLEEFDPFDYISWLGKTNSPESINIYLRHLKVFFRWANSQGFLKSNPLEGIPYVKVPKKLFPTLTPTALQDLLDVAKKLERNSQRNQAILLLLIDVALRPGELLSLTLKDFQGDYIRVRGKTGERMLPLSQVTKRAIQAYLKKRKAPPLEDALFTTSDGRPLTYCALRSIMRFLKRRCKVGRLYPYLFRHTSATSYLQNGADLETVRRLLGHTSYAVTQRYLSLTQNDLARAQRKASPVNKLR
ncbi:MAG: tyrosine-type recombinase/integrase [Coprothermobacterota bacterium]|nr:tyrosine-type recombinase/integrase [Coprothermobacterota bacterium]